MSQALHPMLNTAIKAARSAGSIINRASLDLDLLKVNTKSPNDFVTEVDHKAEAIIIETLLGAYPGHGILAEESGSVHGAKDSEFVWIIDPLDGTTNYTHGFPWFCVSIGLETAGDLVAGVIYNPLHDELFTTTRGGGAFCNGHRLRVSMRSPLQNTLLGTGFPYDCASDPANNFDNFIAFQKAARGIRRAGAAALDLAYVAAGRLDGFWELKLKPWDVAAGVLMVREAGGVVSTFDGSPYIIDMHRIVASNGLIHDEMTALLAHSSPKNQGNAFAR